MWNTKTWKSCFCFFTDSKQHELCKVDTITLTENMYSGHTRHDYLWPWVRLTWLLFNLQLWCPRRRFRKFPIRFRPIRKELESSMYKNKKVFDGSRLFRTRVKYNPRKISWLIAVIGVDMLLAEWFLPRVKGHCQGNLGRTKKLRSAVDVNLFTVWNISENNNKVLWQLRRHAFFFLRDINTSIMIFVSQAERAEISGNFR